eukprot:scaffold25295_cov71-Attheya_sp.AAC.2
MGPAHVFAWRYPPQLSHRVGSPPKVSGCEVASYNPLSLLLTRKPPRVQVRGWASKDRRWYLLRRCGSRWRWWLGYWRCCSRCLAGWRSPCRNYHCLAALRWVPAI